MSSIYETVSVRLSEDIDKLKFEDVCIEFIRSDGHISILLNGIEYTNVIKSLISPITLVAFKICPSLLVRLLNRTESHSISPLFMKGILSKADFQAMWLFGDASLIEEINESQSTTVCQPLYIVRPKQRQTFEALITLIKKRIS